MTDMTYWRCRYSVIIVLGVMFIVIGAMLALLAVCAKFFGLGVHEGFIFYKLFGWTRTNVLCLGGSLGIAGAGVAFLKFYPGFRRCALLGLINAGLVVVGLAAGYVLVEAVFRVHIFVKYHHLPLENVMFVEDEFFREPQEYGYRYLPNKTVHRKYFDVNGDVVYSNTIKTNNCGLISHIPTTVNKDRGEYRIAVLGDSFSAAEHWSQPWEDLVARRLNEDSELKNRMKADKFSVLNFALAGTGIVQQGAFYEHVVKEYNPDLVVLSIIADDVPRVTQWMGYTPDVLNIGDSAVALTCSTPEVSVSNYACAFGPVYKVPFDKIATAEQVQMVRRKIYDEMIVKRINWFRPYPYALAATVPGKKLGYSNRLWPNLDYRFRNEDENEAVDLSLKVVAKLASEKKFVLVELPAADDFFEAKKSQDVSQENLDAKKFITPEREEYVYTLWPEKRLSPLKSSMKRLAERAGPGNFFRLGDRMWLKDRMEAWEGYNKADMHYNDKGAEEVARAMTEVIKEWLTNDTIASR